MCPGGFGSQPSSFGGSASLRPVPITLVECGLDETANDGTDVFDVSVPCPSECLRGVVDGAVSVSGVSVPGTCIAPGALPADVRSDGRRTYPAAVGGFEDLVSERFQKHVSPLSGDVCATFPVSDNLQYVVGLSDGVFQMIGIIFLHAVPARIGVLAWISVCRSGT